MTTNALDNLLGRVADPDLRRALEAEIGVLRNNKDFGLVFERHLPEEVRLLSHPITRGVKVQERKTDSDETWTATAVSGGTATLLNEEGAESTRPIDELVVVRGFGEPIYPGLKSVGKVARGGDKPYHSVINGENFYVLETLLYAYEGQVDCIYIDPPYNSGARDWKYNNDYVDGEDAYRHSKWLSFMEKRLQLAKRLLNPEDSVLIVTIDEKEYLRLGLLLEQVFSGCDIQMISSVISPQGAARKGQFARTDEYLFFVQFGAAAPSKCELPSDWYGNIGSSVKGKLHWSGLRRTGTNARRLDRPNLFYPIYLDADSSLITEVGEPIPLLADRKKVKAGAPKGAVVVWPIRSDGSEGNWQISPAALRKSLAGGFVRVGRPEGSTTTISYLKAGEQKKVQAGTFPITGHRADGSVEVDDSEHVPSFVPGTQWAIRSHDASRNGSNLLRALIPGRSFPFPKSLYAVEDALRFYVKDKPDALIIDFFGGSGTTTHAVARLNNQDGGRRRSIVVTNNEVSDEEAKMLRKAGHYPGQPEWETLGIFEHITRPRVTAAITGKTPAGDAITGDYKFTDEFPMADGFEENVEFFELTYLDHNSVARGKAFEAVAPLLWMKFGALGPIINKVKKPFAAPTGANYAVLFDINSWPEFVEALRGREDVRFACIVTDSLAQFQQVRAELPPTMGVSMLYEDYLRNFEINTGAGR
jgi:adenine-specific DNA-methyltransferase